MSTKHQRTLEVLDKVPSENINPLAKGDEDDSKKEDDEDEDGKPFPFGSGELKYKEYCKVLFEEFNSQFSRRPPP